MANRTAKELARPDQAQQARDRARPRAQQVATLVAEPLERGFGMTLGNALRRVLLSSLQGAAITSRADRRRAARVLLDPRRARGRDQHRPQHQGDCAAHALRGRQAHGAEEGRRRARCKAGDIEASSEVEILNPDHVICTLDQGASIRMEFTAAMGKGYVQAERNRPDDAPDRPDPRRQPLQPGEEGLLQGREHPRGPDPRLRQADDDGRDRRLGHGRGRRGAGRPHPAGPARRVHQLRGAEEGRRGDASIPSSPSMPRCSRRSTSSSCRCARPTA